MLLTIVGHAGRVWILVAVVALNTRPPQRAGALLLLLVPCVFVVILHGLTGGAWVLSSPLRCGALATDLCACS